MSIQCVNLTKDYNKNQVGVKVGVKHNHKRKDVCCGISSHKCAEMTRFQAQQEPQATI